MKIALIGFMGAGKTTVAKLLAKKLQLDYADMDDLILEKSAHQSINDIFEKDGEIAFRELEIAVAKDLQHKRKIVLATGGGVVMNKIVLDYLGADGVIVFLKTSYEKSDSRANKSTRPLFKDAVKARELYNFRMPLYERYANMIVETDNKTAEQVADEIAKIIGHI